MVKKKRKFDFSKVNKISIDVVAQTVFEYYKDFDEISFLGNGGRFLCQKICSNLKIKYDNQKRLYYQSLWIQNVGNIQAIVKEKFFMTINKTKLSNEDLKKDLHIDSFVNEIPENDVDFCSIRDDTNGGADFEKYGSRYLNVNNAEQNDIPLMLQSVANLDSELPLQSSATDLTKNLKENKDTDCRNLMSRVEKSLISFQVHSFASTIPCLDSLDLDIVKEDVQSTLSFNEDEEIVKCDKRNNKAVDTSKIHNFTETFKLDGDYECQNKIFRVENSLASLHVHSSASTVSCAPLSNLDVEKEDIGQSTSYLNDYNENVKCDEKDEEGVNELKVNNCAETFKLDDDYECQNKIFRVENALSSLHVHSSASTVSCASLSDLDVEKQDVGQSKSYLNDDNENVKCDGKDEKAGNKLKVNDCAETFKQDGDHEYQDIIYRVENTLLNFQAHSSASTIPLASSDLDIDKEDIGKSTLSNNGDEEIVERDRKDEKAGDKSKVYNFAETFKQVGDYECQNQNFRIENSLPNLHVDLSASTIPCSPSLDLEVERDDFGKCTSPLNGNKEKVKWDENREKFNYESEVLEFEESEESYSEKEEDSDSDRNDRALNDAIKTRANKYTQDVAAVKLPTLGLVSDEGKVEVEAVRNSISIIFKDNLMYGCELSFSSPRLNSGGQVMGIPNFVIYAKCLYVSHIQDFKCRLYPAYAPRHQPYSTIYIYGTPCKEVIHSGEKICKKLKNKKRKQAQKVLQYVSPRNFQLQLVKGVDLDKAQDGNLGEMYSLTVLEKAKSEKNCENSLTFSSPELLDLFGHWAEDQKLADPYIRQVSLPLKAIMFSEEQLAAIPYPRGIVHFDATGSVVRTPSFISKTCKRLLWYVLLVNYGELAIPIADMISSEHNVDSISHFLGLYKSFIYLKYKKWPYFDIVVIDWNWASIHAIMKEWNNTDVIGYLETAFDCLFKNKDFKDTDLTVVYNCNAHFDHRVSDGFEKHFSTYVKKSEDHKPFLMECISVMQHCRTINELNTVFDSFMIILMSKNFAVASTELKKLTGQRTKYKKKTEEANEETEVDDVIDMKEGENQKCKEKRLYVRSPFFKYYKDRLTVIEKKVETAEANNDKVTNEFYCPDLAQYIVKKYMTYAVMWTGVLLEIVSPNIARISNAYIESFFRVIKHDILGGILKRQIRRFIRQMQDYTFTLIKSIPLGPIKRRRRNRHNYPQAEGNRVESKVEKQKSEKRKRNESNLDDNEDNESLPKKKSKKNAKKIHDEKDIMLIAAKTGNQENDLDDSEEETLFEAEEHWEDNKQKVSHRYNERKCLKRLSKRKNPEIKQNISEPKISLTEISKKELRAASDIKDSTLPSKPTPNNVSNFSSWDNILSKQSENSIHENALPNGLFLDAEYYFAVTKISTTLGKYDATFKPIISANHIFTLFQDQFATLQKHRWVDGTVIDCYVITFLKEIQNVSYIPSGATSLIVGDYHSNISDKWYMLSIERKLNGKLLIPYLSGGHWRLLVVDIRKKELILFDPFRETNTNFESHENERKRVLKNFIDFIKLCTPKSSFGRMQCINWTIKSDNSIERPTQRDSINCGVFVTYYIETIVTNQPFDPFFDPELFREKMSRRLLMSSMDMSKTCLHCFVQKSTDDLIMCATCRRWAHRKCTLEDHSLEEWSKKTFICVLCIVKPREWMKKESKEKLVPVSNI